GYGQLGNRTNETIMVPTRNLLVLKVISNNFLVLRYDVDAVAYITSDIKRKYLYNAFKVAAYMPQDTDIRIIISKDKNEWLAYKDGNWISVEYSNIKESGMTVSEFETLGRDELSIFDNQEISIAVGLMTNDENKTPEFRGIDAYVRQAVESPVVESLSVHYEVDPEEDNLKYYVSLDGENWQRIEKDKLENLKETEGSSLQVKVIAENGEEIHGLSYSWI